MNKILSILSGIAVLLFIGCSTADDKIPQIAGDYCGCLSDMEKSLGSKTKDIMKRAVEAADPEKTMASEMEKLSEEDKATVGTEMATIASIGNKDSKAGKCLTDVDKKYEKARTYDKEKFEDKLIKELESRPGCAFTAALMKAGLKLKDGKD